MTAHTRSGNTGVFDVIVVGAGPGGATAAYYLGRARGEAAPRVALLEKAHFPRDKVC